MVELTDRFTEALVYATRLHAGQGRKGNTPYVGHLLAVTALVLEDGGDEDEAIAGLLHDAVEEQGGMPRLVDIRLKFGDRVAAIVASCTESETLPKPSWQERKERYIEQMQHADVGTVRVSLADKIDGVRSMLALLNREGELAWGYFKGGRDRTLWFYRELIEVYRTKDVGGMVDELEKLVRELEGGQSENGFGSAK